MKRYTTALLTGTALSTMATTGAFGAILPSGATVQNGDVSISVNHNHMQVTQSTDKAILDWDSFSVGEKGSVHFAQPNTTSSILNRVVGNEKSTVAGTITATGQVFLVNPNGILFTDTANVNTAGFTASTLDIANDDFLNGSTSFTDLKNTKNNAGTIATVENRGYIASADNSIVALYGGDVMQGGTVTTKGGKIILSANNTATVSGKLDTSDTTANTGTGGRIDVSAGQNVTLTNTATITATGTKAGGLVRIGGAFQGNNDYLWAKIGDKQKNSFKNRWGVLDSITNTNNTFMEAGAKIDVSADSTGGTVVLWSEKNTQQFGSISADGTTGGSVELSSKKALKNIAIENVSTGQGGDLLLDPHHIKVISAYPTTYANNTAYVLNTTIQNYAGDVTLVAGDTIVVDAEINKTNGTLLLYAGGDITINKDIRVAYLEKAYISYNGKWSQGRNGNTLLISAGYNQARLDSFVASYGSTLNEKVINTSIIAKEKGSNISLNGGFTHPAIKTLGIVTVNAKLGYNTNKSSTVIIMSYDSFTVNEDIFDKKIDMYTVFSNGKLSISGNMTKNLVFLTSNQDITIDAAKFTNIKGLVNIEANKIVINGIFNVDSLSLTQKQDFTITSLSMFGSALTYITLISKGKLDVQIPLPYSTVTLSSGEDFTIKSTYFSDKTGTLNVTSAKTISIDSSIVKLPNDVTLKSGNTLSVTASQFDSTNSLTLEAPNVSIIGQLKSYNVNVRSTNDLVFDSSTVDETKVRRLSLYTPKNLTITGQVKVGTVKLQADNLSTLNTSHLDIAKVSSATFISTGTLAWPSWLNIYSVTLKTKEKMTLNSTDIGANVKSISLTSSGDIVVSGVLPALNRLDITSDKENFTIAGALFDNVNTASIEGLNGLTITGKIQSKNVTIKSGKDLTIDSSLFNISTVEHLSITANNLTLTGDYNLSSVNSSYKRLTVIVHEKLTMDASKIKVQNGVLSIYAKTYNLTNTFSQAINKLVINGGGNASFDAKYLSSAVNEIYFATSWYARYYGVDSLELKGDWSSYITKVKAVYRLDVLKVDLKATNISAASLITPINTLNGSNSIKNLHLIVDKDFTLTTQQNTDILKNNKTLLLTYNGGSDKVTYNGTATGGISSLSSLTGKVTVVGIKTTGTVSISGQNATRDIIIENAKVITGADTKLRNLNILNAQSVIGSHTLETTGNLSIYSKGKVDILSVISNGNINIRSAESLPNVSAMNLYAKNTSSKIKIDTITAKYGYVTLYADKITLKTVTAKDTVKITAKTLKGDKVTANKLQLLGTKDSALIGGFADTSGVKILEKKTCVGGISCNAGSGNAGASANNSTKSSSNSGIAIAGGVLAVGGLGYWLFSGDDTTETTTTTGKNVIINNYIYNNSPASKTDKEEDEKKKKAKKNKKAKKKA